MDEPGGDFAGACGQVDVKAVYTANGDERGRVAGPFITTADNCLGGTVTTPAPTTGPPTSSSGGSTIPTSAGPTTCPICTDTTSGSAALSEQTLPETGSNGPLLIVLSAALVVVGVVLVTKGRDRKPLPE